MSASSASLSSTSRPRTASRSDLGSLAQAGDKLKGFVIDLRTSGRIARPGDLGLRRLPGEGEIVSTRGRNAEETQRFNARARRPHQDQAGDRADQRRLGLGLRDRGRRAAGSSARDRRRTRSFGKGSCRPSSRSLGNGALRLTTGATSRRPDARPSKGISPISRSCRTCRRSSRPADTKGEASLRGHLKPRATSRPVRSPTCRRSEGRQGAAQRARPDRASPRIRPIRRPEDAVPN